jgi:hypothetical protein
MHVIVHRLATRSEHGAWPALEASLAQVLPATLPASREARPLADPRRRAAAPLAATRFPVVQSGEDLTGLCGAPTRRAGLSRYSPIPPCERRAGTRPGASRWFQSNYADANSQPRLAILAAPDRPPNLAVGRAGGCDVPLLQRPPAPCRLSTATLCDGAARKGGPSCVCAKKRGASRGRTTY